jgi:hypothetical protein
VADDATVVHDAGALIAVGRRRASTRRFVAEGARGDRTAVVPAPVLAQVWRDGPRQALVARFLNLPFVEVDLLTAGLWRSAGALCGEAGTGDVVDAAVIVCARQHSAGAVITSDPERTCAGWTPP